MTRLLQNWPLKLTAFALSIIVWVVISADETASELVTVQLALTVPENLVLTEPPPAVRALVTGPGHDLIKLYASPLTLRLAVPASATGPRHRITLASADVEVPAGLAVSVQDVEPRELTLDIDRMGRRMVPVARRGAVSAAAGWRLAGTIRIVPAQVEARGPRRVLAALDTARLEPLRLQDVDHDLQRRVPVDTAGHHGVQFTPAEVTMTVRVRRP